MARLQGISGGLSGRTGSYTFRQSRGETIVSQYQPIVKNPNTQGQQTQRAKFKLLTQLAAVMAPGVGTMGVTKRAGHGIPTQRNEFFKLNYELVTAADTAQGVVASIPMEKLKLTSSFRSLGSISAEKAGTSLDTLVVVSDASVESVRLVYISYPEAGGMKQAAIMQIKDVPVSSGMASDTITSIPAGDYTVLAYGLIPTETAAGKISLDSIHTPSDDDFISAVELDKLVADGALVETMTIGTNVSIA